MLEDWFEMKKGLEKRVMNLEALVAKEAHDEREKGREKTGIGEIYLKRRFWVRNGVISRVFG